MLDSKWNFGVSCNTYYNAIQRTIENKKYSCREILNRCAHAVTQAFCKRVEKEVCVFIQTNSFLWIIKQKKTERKKMYDENRMSTNKIFWLETPNNFKTPCKKCWNKMNKVVIYFKFLSNSWTLPNYRSFEI